jgi:hypothetical protein
LVADTADIPVPDTPLDDIPVKHVPTIDVALAAADSVTFAPYTTYEPLLRVIGMHLLILAH